jgi:sodium-dependent phosphate cotransporter
MDNVPEDNPQITDASLGETIPSAPSALSPRHPNAISDEENGRVLERPWYKRLSVWKLGLFLASLYLFILAITMMKEGARGLVPLLENVFAVSSIPNSLGFGWLSAYIIMSGSPVAASVLTFFDAGVLDELNTYAMITGSRIGASFIVLFIGFLYVLRGRNLASSLSMGLLSLMVTATTYLPSFFIGMYLLRVGWLDDVQLQFGVLLNAVIDGIINPFVALVSDLFPTWAVFLLGLGIILVSFKLFDMCLPQMSLAHSQIGQVSRIIYHPLVMFALGAAITMISMSVSLSLSILVPLSNRGFIRRENVIPYIMGANVTTFVDTLLAAALLDNPNAFTIVLVGMVGITLVSIVTLVMLHHSYRYFALKFVDWVTANKRNMAIFMVIILVSPIVLILLF